MPKELKLFTRFLLSKVKKKETPEKHMFGFQKLKIVFQVSFAVIKAEENKGGFPLWRNFYVPTDVNFNWLYMRK